MVTRRWLYALLPLAGLVELVLAVVDHTGGATSEEYAQLEPALADVALDRDVVVVSPRWAEPHVRRALGDRYFPLDALARSDIRVFERAIEISAYGETSEELEGFRETSRKDVGPFVVRTLENPRYEPVVFDFVAGLEPRWASAGGTDPQTSCSWNERARLMTGGLGGHPTFPRRRFECPESPYLNVSVTVVADQEFMPRRCIWAHPPLSGERVVRFSGVPLGEKIVGHAGMYWMIERARIGAPVDMVVRVDGEVVGTVTHADGEGWKRFELPLGAHARKDKATVEFGVSSVDYRDRHFCFQADTR